MWPLEILENPGAYIPAQRAGQRIDCDFIQASASTISPRPSSPPWISPIRYRMTQP